MGLGAKGGRAPLLRALCPAGVPGGQAGARAQPLNTRQACPPRHASGGRRRQEGKARGRGGQAPGGRARAEEAVRGEEGGARRKISQADHSNVRRRGLCRKHPARGGRKGKGGTSRQGVILSHVWDWLPRDMEMSLPLHVVDGKFIARCSLLGDPDQDILGVVDSGSNATCVDRRVCSRANLRFSGDAVLNCVHRNHADVVKTRFVSVSICGGIEQTTVYELDMGPESEATGINAILGMDVLGGIRITLDGLTGTSTMERRAPV